MDLGEEKSRQIVAGIAEFFPQEQELVGKQITILANLEPRIIKGYESQGMILAIKDDSGLSLLIPSKKMLPGSKVS